MPQLPNHKGDRSFGFLAANGQSIENVAIEWENIISRFDALPLQAIDLVRSIWLHPQNQEGIYLMSWRLSSQVLIAPVVDEAVLLDATTGDRFVLNEMGLNICILLKAGCDLPAIVAEIQQIFPDRAAEIPTDVEEFIALLQAEKLVEWQP